ncbi:hypothetical protein NDU88_004330 [Pleurodeles waltl]|uniref:Uncharacterized protein n=1 Tax=Pleurodeles waltl TaxID=8319 RepID=A0AAV7M619_PLEWA|nr:hypothetical protein NDU88_004330 [Pleurodeles waltl]
MLTQYLVGGAASLTGPRLAGEEADCYAALGMKAGTGHGDVRRFQGKQRSKSGCEQRPKADITGLQHNVCETVKGQPSRRLPRSTPGAPVAPAGLTQRYCCHPPIQSNFRVNEGSGNPSSGHPGDNNMGRTTRKTTTSLEREKEDRGKRLMNSDEPSEYRDQRCRTSIPQSTHDIGRVFSEAGKEDQEAAT